MSKSGKILLSGGLILASGAYAWWQHLTHPEKAIPAPAPVAQRQSAPAPRLPAVAQTPSPVTPSPPTPPPVTAQAQPAAEPPVEHKAPRTKTAAANPARATAFAPPQVQPEIPPPEPLQAVQLAPPPPVSTGRYADGEFVGNAVDGQWGPVQVKAIIRNGDLADVIVIEFPIHRQRSAEISEWAIPLLYEEAIKAQSADIDMISQASFTSEEFQQSLASALTRAHKP
jgi:uncharacterized protein with FMN-binding domain